MSTSPIGTLRASRVVLLGLAACGGSITNPSELDEPNAGSDGADGSADLTDASANVGDIDADATVDADADVCATPTPVMDHCGIARLERRRDRHRP